MERSNLKNGQIYIELIVTITFMVFLTTASCSLYKSEKNTHPWMKTLQKSSEEQQFPSTTYPY